MANDYKSTQVYCYSYSLDCNSNTPYLGVMPAASVMAEPKLLNPWIACDCSNDPSCDSSSMSPSGGGCCSGGGSGGMGGSQGGSGGAIIR